mgnify:CR=1 FL=1
MAARVGTRAPWAGSISGTLRVMIRRRARITGRVQGVFFRDSCRREAQTGGVSGWVTNRPDGSVESVVEGAADAVDELIAWCREHLAHYKCPKSVDVLDLLPRNPTGKILKRELRAPYWEGRERSVN